MAVLGAGFAWEPGVLDSIDPAELESPDPEASPLEVPLSAEAALACAGGDDMRCQPLHESESPGGPRLLLTSHDVGVPASSSPRLGPSAAGPRVFGRTRLLGAGLDLGAELLRPPRG